MPTINEIWILKDRLEKLIVKELRNFENETGLTILSMDIECIIPEEIEKVHIVSALLQKSEEI